MSTRPSLTIGIEEEYQTIDPESRDLRSHIQAEIIERSKTVLAERVKPAWACIVPESRQELTTEGGLDVAKMESRLAGVVKRPSLGW